MSIELEKAYCLFHNYAGNEDAGGCTKAWLDLNSGDPTKLFLEGTHNPMYTFTNTREYDLTAFTPGSSGLADMDLAYVGGLGSAETGMVASILLEDIRYEDYHQKVMHEITASGNARTVDGVSVDHLTVTSVVDYGTHMVVFVASSVEVLAGQRIRLIGMPNSSDDKWVTVLNDVTDDTYFEVGPSILTAGTGLTAYALPAMAEIYVGGAYSVIQDAIDESDAGLVDSWVFFGSDIPATDYDNYVNSADGDYVNNTKKYFVGYKDTCYDSLPAGYGYFPEALGDGANYQKPLKWRNDCMVRTESANQAVLSSALRKVNLEATTAIRGTFELSDSNGGENLSFMGFYVTSTSTSIANCLIATSQISTRLSGIDVAHCVFKTTAYESSIASDSFNAYPCLTRVTGTVGLFEIHDCTALGGGLELGGVGYTGDVFKIHDCCIDRSSRYYSRKDASVHIYNNFILNSKWGVWLEAGSNVHVYNNTFYRITHAPFRLVGDGSGVVAEAIDIRNNIIVMNSDSTWTVLNTHGIYYEYGGGTVKENYNCFCYDDGDTNVKWRADVTLNAYWIEPVIGDNSIKADPMFADAAGGDFRPINPKVMTGGKPSNRVATYMGAVPPKLNSRSNARVANFGRMATVRSS